MILLLVFGNMLLTPFLRLHVFFVSRVLNSKDVEVNLTPKERVFAVFYQQYLGGLILFLFVKELCHAHSGRAQRQGTNVPRLYLQVFIPFSDLDC